MIGNIGDPQYRKTRFLVLRGDIGPSDISIYQVGSMTEKLLDYAESQHSLLLAN